MIASPLAALVTWLAGRPELHTLVEGRVYGAELPPGAAASMPRKAVLCRYAGMGTGPGARDYVRRGSARVDLWCYGETPYEAERVRLVAYAALKELERALVGTTLIFPVVKLAGPIPIRDPDTDWPIVVDTYQLATGEADQAA